MKKLIRSHNVWIFLACVIGIGAIGLWASHIDLNPTPETVPQPLQIQSQAWRIGADIELTLVSEPSYSGQAVSLTLLAPGPAQTEAGLQSKDSDSIFGLAGVQLTWLPPKQQEEEIALAAASGARYIGLDFDWRVIEPEHGKYYWAGLDRVVELARQYNLILVPMLMYTPQWASSASFAPLDYHRAPPTHLSDYRDFVYAVVNRYKPYGQSDLTADGYGISDWVIWNEPNSHNTEESPNPGEFWSGSLDEYIQLLRAGYEGAHAADPNCNVLNGALTDVFWTDDQSDIVSALERLYDPNGDGDASDGARPFFDTLNIHLYQLDTPDPAWYTNRLEKLGVVMRRFGDETKLIWITETGYGSVSNLPAQPQGSSFPYVSEEVQADAVRMVYSSLLAYPGVGRVFWWSLRDYYGNYSIRNEAMEAHFGLLRANFSPKPAYLAYTQKTGFVSQTLVLSILLDDQGTAKLRIPGSFITQEGIYTVFGQLDDETLTTIATYQVMQEPGTQ